jgi:hypothetical protein
MQVCDIKRTRVVLLTLGHLGSFFSEYNTVYDQVLEGRAIFDGTGNDHQGVEPSSGLVEAFCNKVSWEALFEFLFIH